MAQDAEIDFEVTELTPVIGAEISGLDLRVPLAPPTIKRLREIWLERGVLVFRDQDLSVEQQINFAACFGTPSRTNTQADKDRDPRILLISNIRKDGVPIGALPDGELQFHSDSAFHAEPLMATLLYSVEVPDSGGNTLFASATAAWQRLPDDLKSRLGSLTARNVYDYSTQVKNKSYDHADGPQAIHPVVRTHPETGQKAIYVNQLMTEEILDLPEGESSAVLNDLFDRMEDPDIRYTHVWRPGDLLMWDNRCVQHARTDFPSNQRRLLRRVGLIGDRPY